MPKPYYYLVSPLAYTGSAGAFTYHSDSQLSPGSLVQIPLGARQLTGVVDRETPKPSFATKPISTVLDLPPLPADLLDLAAWLITYYAASPASVWSTFLPTGLTKKRRATASVQAGPATGLPSAPLTPDQRTVIEAIRVSAKQTHLLQGVTGSGKTRVYLELAADAIASGRSVIILVPEIILTPQIINQFEGAFGPIVLATHSKMTEAQRHQIWSQAVTAQVDGRAQVIVGPRSSLFLPTHNLGLIVIDECHENTYKQEQNPKYQALTVAAKRASLNNAKLILGSATPGLEQLFLAGAGRIEQHKLLTRINEIPHATATILDLRDKQLFKLSKFITQPLIDAVAETIGAGRQALLYLNRRGSASSQVCGDCGNVTNCPNCHLPLTFHADLMRLICHHCNFRATSAAVCPECGGADLKLLGAGTKRIEAEVGQLWPHARVARLDRDNATVAHLTSVLKGLSAGEIDILVGTQMITKGLDLPGIDTVGIVGADTLLHLPDFTAAERTFQLLSQVSGRAGRGDRAGRIFIQTYSPDHPAITAAATGAFEQFAKAELAERQQLNYPPYVYLLKLTVTSRTREVATSSAGALVRSLASRPGISVTGPAPAFLEHVAGKFQWIVTVKAKSRPPLVQIASNLSSSDWTADLDPANLL